MRKIIFFGLLSLSILGINSCKDPKPEVKKTDLNLLKIEVQPTFNGMPITIGNFMGTNASGDTLKLNIWKFLLSGFKLNQVSGGNLVLPQQYAYLSTEENKLSFSLTGLSEGNFNGFDFVIGVDSTTNHADPAQWAGGQPLNPALNGMHWGWAGGYIFMMLEGEYKHGKKGTYSFHMATDDFKKSIHVSVPTFSYAKFNTSKTMVLELKLDEVFKNPSNYSIIIDGAYSHSGSTDLTPMGKMFGNIADIFTFKEFK